MATLANSSGNTKKPPTKTHPRTPSSIKTSSITKRRVYDYLVSVLKTELVVRAALDQREPSLRSASNNIHTKSEADNL